MTGLSIDQRVIVSLSRLVFVHGVIKDETEKRYLVLLDGETQPRWFPKSKVSPETTRKPTPKLEPIPGVRIGEIKNSSVFMMTAGLRPIPKPEPPERCEAWLAMVRKKPCCNCLSEPNVQAHHEGKKDAFAQKVRDTLALNLGFACHSVYTAKNRLPIRLKPDGVYHEKDLHTREQSVSILRSAQDHLLSEVLAQLDQPTRIELLSKALAQLEPGELREALGRIGEGA